MIPVELKAPVTILDNWLGSNDNRTLVLYAGVGCGRGHWVKLKAAEWGIDLQVHYDDKPTNNQSLDDKPQIGVYDWDKWLSLSHPRAIVMLPMDAEIPREYKKRCVITAFPKPTQGSLKLFLSQKGISDVSLPENACWWDVIHCVELFEAGQSVKMASRSNQKVTWQSFADGGECPTETNFLPYYAAYNEIDPWPINRAIWLQRKIPVRMFEVALDEFRLHVNGELKFPRLFYSKREEKKAVVVVKSAGPKTYTMPDW